MSEAMEEAKTALAEVIEAARTGAIIPVRLPGQLDAIWRLLLQAEKDHDKTVAELKNRPGGAADAVRLENAEFLRTAVHELRTPMTSIRGYGDLLANPDVAGELSGMQKQLLDVIRANTLRLEGLLADLSTLNKIQGGILQINPTMDLFKNVALRAEQATRSLAEELNQQLVFDIPQGLPLLNTDGELMALALGKLIENGLRYSAEGEGRVVVRGRAEDNTLVVTVEDNGCGMSAEELQSLGTAFFRSDDDAVRAHKGSGLGVPIAYGLVAALGGSIAVTSQPGEGTTFTLRFEGMT